MQVQTKIPAFDDFSGIMAQGDLMANPAELHGILVGFICIGQKFDGKFWFDTMLKQLANRSCLAMQQRGAIIDLYDKTCRQLSEGTNEFQLMLPTEQQSFLARAEALSHWCQGFLYGFRLEEGLRPPVSQGLKNAVHCISEIAKLDFSEIEVSEMDQPAYLAAVECVRIAVITTYSELFELPSISGAGNKHPSNRLH